MATWITKPKILTHSFLEICKRVIGKQCLLKGLQCLLTGSSIKNRIGVTKRTGPKMINGLAQHITKESTSIQLVKNFQSSRGDILQ